MLLMQFKAEYVHSLHNQCWGKEGEKNQAGNVLTPKVLTAETMQQERWLLLHLP